MGDVLVIIDGKQVLLERRGPEQIAVYSARDMLPCGTVNVPPAYRGFIIRHHVGHGNNRVYTHSVPWLVENVPEIRNSIHQQIDIYEQIGV